jgi:hypothetical protein
MIALSPSDLFLHSQRKAVLAQLPTFDWKFTLGLGVRLRAGEHSVDTRQIGTGNHEGKATVLLSPRGEWSVAEAKIRAMIDLGGPILLEPIS